MSNRRVSRDVKGKVASNGFSFKSFGSWLQPQVFPKNSLWLGGAIEKCPTRCLWASCLAPLEWCAPNQWPPAISRTSPRLRDSKLKTTPHLTQSKSCFRLFSGYFWFQKSHQNTNIQKRIIQKNPVVLILDRLLFLLLLFGSTSFGSSTSFFACHVSGLLHGLLCQGL